MNYNINLHSCCECCCSTRNKNNQPNTEIILNNNNPITVDENKILEYYNKVDVNFKPIGLNNLGLSCYMNAVLQCLFYTKGFREFFIENKNKFSKLNLKTCATFSEVMYNMKTNSKSHSPSNLKTLMGKKNSLFLGIKAGDAKDLFINLIDGIITELTEIKENNNDNDYEYKINFDNNNEEETKKIKNDYLNNCMKDDGNEIFNETIYTYLCTNYQCVNDPNKITVSIANQSFISFELDKIKNHYNGKTGLTVTECFEYEYNREYQTEFSCQYCEKLERSNTKDKIARIPKTLIILLDRGHGKIFRDKMNIEYELNLSKYIDKDYNVLKNKNTKYKIMGVVLHEGESSATSHYTANCLTDNGEYCHFSDSEVNEINKYEMFNNGGDPYILFYERIDNE